MSSQRAALRHSREAPGENNRAQAEQDAARSPQFDRAAKDREKSAAHGHKPLRVEHTGHRRPLQSERVHLE